ncbi:MAG: 4'-phosphopantetheinyl transferase superfamily protein [Proteobacteria bacterium]|nr:4'-phosphopantetheinyl transferase superfamily protein [Pseudomonadota bacterium]
MPPIALPPRAGCTLWLIALGGAATSGAHAVLAADERERAARFRFDRDRHRFVIGRAALRELLAAQVGESAAALRFTYGEQGKPALAQAPHCRFNLSHSGDWGLLALDPLGTCDALGVDIEILRPIRDAVPLAATVLDAGDTQALAALAPAAVPRAFFTAWTRGEACLKAMGTGFSGPNPPAVGLDPAARRVRLALPGADERMAWVESFDLPEAGAIGSLALVLPGKAQCREYEHEMADAA